MHGSELLHLLLVRRGMRPNALATALNGQVKQPQIHKFLTGTAKEPRRTTLAPIAKYFDVPIDAFYDQQLAWQTAVKLGLLPSNVPQAPPAPQAGLIARESSAPYALHPSRESVSLSQALRKLHESLATEPIGVRRSVIAILSDIAENPHDKEFCDMMIERILGALGQQGNARPPRSTTSGIAQSGGNK